MLDIISDIFHAEFSSGKPESYGWFHLMFVGIVIVACILMIKFFRNCSDKTYRKIALIMWIIILVTETYKQCYFFWFDGEGINPNPTYDWYQFPFQFCSTPFYIFPLIAFLKDGKVREACISFTSTFVFLAGVLCYAYPNTVFISEIGICFQTMIHHGIQVVFGLLTAIRYLDKVTFKRYIPAVIILVGFIAIAIASNEIFYIFNKEDTFNMFFISSHYDTVFPILINIQQSAPYIVFLLSYIFGFAFLGFIIHLIWMGIKLIKTKVQLKKNQQ